MTKKIKTESLDRDEMFTLLPPHVLAVSERALTDNQKMFLALLKKQATMNGTNESLMSASDSASELCGFCKRTLYNSVRPRLVELGLITPRIGEHGGKKINYYTLNTDRLNDRDFFNELNKEYDMAKKTPKKENKNELRRLKKEIEELKNEVTQLKNYLYTCIPKNSNGYTAENVDKQEVHDLYTCIPDNVPKYTPKYTAENADNQQVFLYTQNQKNDKGYTYDMICNEINSLLQNLLVTGTSQEKIPERKLTYSQAHARVDEHVGDEILDLLEDGNPDGQARLPQTGSEISAEKNLPLSGSDASAQESEPQPEGTTNEDEDVPFDEFVLNPKQPSGKATSVATETTPQPRNPKNNTPPDPPRAETHDAPLKTEMPSGSQKCPVSDFNQSGGPTIHPTQKNRSEAIYGPRTLRELITAAEDAIANAKQTRTRIGKYTTLEECMEIVNSMDGAYKAIASVVKQAQERARMDEIGYTGYTCVDAVWETDRSVWTERQKNKIYRMAQDVDNLMLHHPWKCRIDRLHELISNLAHEPNREKGEKIKETILGSIDALMAIADGSAKRTRKLNDIITGDLRVAINEHDRLASVVDENKKALNTPYNNEDGKPPKASVEEECRKLKDEAIALLGEGKEHQAYKTIDMAVALSANKRRLKDAITKEFNEAREELESAAKEPDTPYRSINELMDDNGTLSVTVEPETPYGKRNELARRAVYRKTG